LAIRRDWLFEPAVAGPSRISGAYRATGASGIAALSGFASGA